MKYYSTIVKKKTIKFFFKSLNKSYITINAYDYFLAIIMLQNFLGEEKKLLKALKYYFFININLEKIKESLKYIFLYSFTKEKIKSKTLITIIFLFDIKDYGLVNLMEEMEV
tara:strand:- start:636 stop:971 length:336 start_codon:yes stop_codon:yes gene_type:complete